MTHPSSSQPPAHSLADVKVATNRLLQPSHFCAAGPSATSKYRKMRPPGSSALNYHLSSSLARRSTCQRCHFWQKSTRTLMCCTDGHRRQPVAAHFYNFSRGVVHSKKSAYTPKKIPKKSKKNPKKNPKKIQKKPPKNPRIFLGFKIRRPYLEVNNSSIIVHNKKNGKKQEKIQKTQKIYKNLKKSEKFKKSIKIRKI